MATADATITTAFEQVGAENLMSVFNELRRAYAEQGADIQKLNEVTREYSGSIYGQRRELALMHSTFRTQNAELLAFSRIMGEVGSLGRSMLMMWASWTIAQIRLEDRMRDLTEAQKSASEWQATYNQYLKDFGKESVYARDALRRLDQAQKDVEESQRALAKAQQENVVGYISMAFYSLGTIKTMIDLYHWIKISMGLGGIGGLVASLKALGIALSSAAAGFAVLGVGAIIIWALGDEFKRFWEWLGLKWSEWTGILNWDNLTMAWEKTKALLESSIGKFWESLELKWSEWTGILNWGNILDLWEKIKSALENSFGAFWKKLGLDWNVWTGILTWENVLKTWNWVESALTNTLGAFWRKLGLDWNVWTGILTWENIKKAWTDFETWFRKKWADFIKWVSSLTIPWPTWGGGGGGAGGVAWDITQTAWAQKQVETAEAKEKWYREHAYLWGGALPLNGGWISPRAVEAEAYYVSEPTRAIVGEHGAEIITTPKAIARLRGTSLAAIPTPIAPSYYAIGRVGAAGAGIEGIAFMPPTGAYMRRQERAMVGATLSMRTVNITNYFGGISSAIDLERAGETMYRRMMEKLGEKY